MAILVMQLSLKSPIIKVPINSFWARAVLFGVFLAKTLHRVIPWELTLKNLSEDFYVHSFLQPQLVDAYGNVCLSTLSSFQKFKSEVGNPIPLTRFEIVFWLALFPGRYLFSINKKNLPSFLWCLSSMHEKSLNLKTSAINQIKRDLMRSALRICLNFSCPPCG